MVLERNRFNFVVLSRLNRFTPDRNDHSMENILFSDKVQIERKQFFFDLKENPRGRFLRITEDVGGRRDTIIIPATGLEQFRDLIDAAIQAGQEQAVPESVAS